MPSCKTASVQQWSHRPALLIFVVAILLASSSGCRRRHVVQTGTPAAVTTPTATPTVTHPPELLTQIGERPVHRINNALYYRADLAIDADGAPTAYHPNNDALALDYLANGYPWGIVVVDGSPIIQGPSDPAPGFYVSTTSLFDASKRITDPQRYVDASRVPYVVIPPLLRKRGWVQLGDMAIVVDLATGREAYAIIADIGPSDKLGEGSLALAAALGLNKDAKHGGPVADLAYLLFPNSGNGSPLPVSDIEQRARAAYRAWGGAKHLREVIGGNR
jgi:hypothetical protein